MNAIRAKTAIDDLLDCAEMYRDRCYWKGFPNEGDEVLRVSHRIHQRLAEVSGKGKRRNEARAWSALRQSLEIMAARLDYLHRQRIVNREEMEFIQELLEEVHKFIRRYFAKREAPEWRRGA